MTNESFRNSYFLSYYEYTLFLLDFPIFLYKSIKNTIELFVWLS